MFGSMLTRRVVAITAWPSMRTGHAVGTTCWPTTRRRSRFWRILSAEAMDRSDQISTMFGSFALQRWPDGGSTRATDEADRVAREEGVGQVNHYNVACVFAVSSAAAENDGKLAVADRTRLKSQYADLAVDFLRQAVAEGYQDINMLNGDLDLASLRSREDFRKLVRELERKSQK